jgi:hypothetical protein
MKCDFLMYSIFNTVDFVKMDAEMSDQEILASLNAETYRTLMVFSRGDERQREIVKATMRHIEPLLMTLGHLYAHVDALLVREEAHDETDESIREKMLSFTPATLVLEFMPRLTRDILDLNGQIAPGMFRFKRNSPQFAQHFIPFNLILMTEPEVLWQPLTIVLITGELCVNSSFNDKLIEANAQITEAILALNRFKHEHAPSPPPDRPVPPEVSGAPHFPFTVASISPSGPVRQSDLFQRPELVIPFSPAHVPAFADDAADADDDADAGEDADIMEHLHEESDAMVESIQLQHPPQLHQQQHPLQLHQQQHPPQLGHRRSYTVMLHGRTLSPSWFEFPIDEDLKHVSYTSPYAGQLAPHRTIRLPNLPTVHGAEFISAPDPNEHRDVIFGNSGQRCPTGTGWVGLNPVLFACDSFEELADPILGQFRQELLPYIGIWAFDSVDGRIISNSKRNIINVEQLIRLYNTDRSYGTYRLLFEIMKKNLEQTRRTTSLPFSVNIVFHICRGGDLTQTFDHMAATNKFLVQDTTMEVFMRNRFFKYPDGAQIVRVSQVPNHVMEMIGFNLSAQFVHMHPLGSRHVRHGLHFVLQGCFYNLMVYLGIISHVGGEVMTSIQNKGINSRMFLNFVDLMNRRRSFAGLRHFDQATCPFIVERLPIALIQPDAALVHSNGISKLLHVMIDTSEKFITTMSRGERPPPHAILVKLFHRRRGERSEQLVNEEELGHWVAFILDPNDSAPRVPHEFTHYQRAIAIAPWRFVDPQGLSIRTEHQPDGTPFSYTVPMSFKLLRTLDELCTSLNEFEPKFSHIDLFYIAMPPDQVPQGFTLPSGEITNSGVPLGGKRRRTKKHLKKSKSKSKPKSKTKTKSKPIGKRSKRSKRKH